MIKLIKSIKGTWIVSCDDHNVYAVGDLEQATDVLTALGVALDEIQIALEELQKKGDNVADFGIDKRFTFSARFSNLSTLAA